MFLAWRYLRTRKGWMLRGTHLLTVLGLSLGIFALLSVNSAMNGLRNDMQKRIIGTRSEIMISERDNRPITDHQIMIAQIKAMGFHAAPIIRNELTIKHRDLIVPTISFGIDLVQSRRVSRILDRIPVYKAPKSGTLNQGLISGDPTPDEFDGDGIILGAGLANQLGINLKDEVMLISPLFSEPSAFGMLPLIRRVRVVGIFSAGMPEYDQMFSYIPISLGAFFRRHEPSEHMAANSGVPAADYIAVSTPDHTRSKTYAQQLGSAFPGFRSEDWSSFDPNLYAAIRFEKAMMFVIMLMMYVIASFNLTGNILKNIAQKKKELGLLKALGYKTSDLHRLFHYQSTLLCLLGISFGMGLSLFALYLQHRFGLVRLSFAPGDFLIIPVKLQAWDFLLIPIAAFTITFISTILPLSRLRHIDAVSLIRQRN